MKKVVVAPIKTNKKLKVSKVNIKHTNRFVFNEDPVAKCPLIDEYNMYAEWYDSTSKMHHIGFDIQELPYCCGVMEIGVLTINKTFPQDAFNNLMENCLVKGLTCVINTNGVNDSITFEKLLAKCPYFIKIKQFVNSNSNRTITMWVSNNE